MVQFQHNNSTHKHISYCHNFFQNTFFSREHQKKEIKSPMQIMAEICQNRTTGKDDFFRKSYVAQIKKWSTKNSCGYSPGLRKKNSGHFEFTVILYEFNSGQQKSVSCAEIRNIVSTFH